MKKRYGKPRARRGEIKMQWGKLPGDCEDMCFAWGEGTDKCDSRMMHYYFTTKHYDFINKSFTNSMFEELEYRGYDLKTLKFSIQKKKN